MKRFLNVLRNDPWEFLAPDTGDTDSDIGQENTPEVEIDATGEDEVDYLIEGTPEAQAAMGGEKKTPDELYEELQRTREELLAVKSKGDSNSVLADTMKEFLQTVKPPVARKNGAAVIPGALNPTSQMNDKQFQEYINQLMLENPYQAQQEMQARTIGPLITQMAVNNSELSKEMMLNSAEGKELYAKYGDEIEDIVAETPLNARIQNPKVYQKALETVKMKHSSELAAGSIAEQIQAGIRAGLLAAGIDPDKPKKPATIVANAPQSITSRPPAAGEGRRAVVIPAAVVKEANIRGISPEFYYNRLKEQGRI